MVTKQMLTLLYSNVINPISSVETQWIEIMFVLSLKCRNSTLHDHSILFLNEFSEFVTKFPQALIISSFAGGTHQTTQKNINYVDYLSAEQAISRILMGVIFSGVIFHYFAFN